MESIRHRIGITAEPRDVYDAIATRDGGTRWWTRDVEGDETLGGELTYRFGSPERAAVMELAELAPPSRVVWRCVKGPDEWVGTTITFDLGRDGDETVVLFTHAGWQDPSEFMHHCTTAWGYFLLSLKHDVEAGAGTPFPDHEKISSWG